MTKWLLHAWFDTTNNREAYYLGTVPQGNWSREILKLYKRVDLISKFIHVIPHTTHSLSTIKLAHITGKAVLVKKNQHSFIVKQPNNFEKH
jgi:hypothetical protein